MSNFEEGRAQGEKLGGVIFIGFRIIWFFTRVFWWLGQFLIISLVVGIVALFRHGRSAPDETVGFGHFSPDGERWQDNHNGQWYPVADQPQEQCVVEASMGGLALQRNALSRLVRRGAIFRYTFAAVGEEASGETPLAVAEFIQEARHNITLDSLDPAMDDVVRYDLHNNFAEVDAALKHLDWLLTQQGWKDTGERHGHWYAAVYERSIRWNVPIAAQGSPSADTPAGDSGSLT
jgi:hypothetical protein